MHLADAAPKLFHAPVPLSPAPLYSFLPHVASGIRTAVVASELSRLGSSSPLLSRGLSSDVNYVRPPLLRCWPA